MNGSGSASRGELAARVASAAVMIAASLAAAWFGGWPWALLASAVMAGCAWEWNRMAAPAAGDHWLRALLAAVCGLVFVLGGPRMEALAVLGFFFSLARLTDGARFVALAGAAWLALGGWALAGLRDGEGDSGRILLLGLFAIVWATDSAAYAVGRLVGGPRLMPVISPNKTWSGSLGGTGAGIVAGALWGWICGADPLWWGLAGWALAVATQFGDLLESLAKRRFGVKDASDLIPGHGGVLDRLDGHFAAALLLAVLLAAVPDLRGYLAP